MGFEKLDDCSEWTIWIDDLDGELAMEAHDRPGRSIDVVAREEVAGVITKLESEKSQLIEVVRELVGALTWYTNCDNYSHGYYGSTLSSDEDKAREVLTKHKELLAKYGINN